MLPASLRPSQGRRGAAQRPPRRRRAPAPRRRTAATTAEPSAAPPSRPEYIPGRIDDDKYVRIFDTTLRDGEQSPGATLTSREKLEIARNLAKLRVDIIEAGFPIASPDDFAAVKQIADVVGNAIADDGYVPVICGLSRTKTIDLERAWDAVKSAKRPRVHTFIATSPVHMEYKLRMSEDEVVAAAVAAVTHLRGLGCSDIEFSPEDAGRSERRFLYRILGEVIAAGATTLNIPDTTGWNLPHEFGALIADLQENVAGAEDVVFSTHCQNDLGLSTANSLAGAQAGARQIECTINGIGERAGNASLEEVTMAIALRGSDELGGLRTGVNPSFIYPTSKMVSDFTGMVVQPHKAIVGANAFAHESGIHQDGMLKNRGTYEIMSPETIGLSRAESDVGVVLGKHSGRNALRTRLAVMGYELQDEALNEVFKRFKTLCDSKKRVGDEDIVALVSDEAGQVVGGWVLLDFQVVCGTMGLPTATVKLQSPLTGEPIIASAVGTGPVDAAYKAVDSVVDVSGTLEDYSVSAVTAGIDSVATTRVTIRPAGAAAGQAVVTNAQDRTFERSFAGQGVDVDIVVASIRAYIAALNKMRGFVVNASAAGHGQGEGETRANSAEPAAAAA